MIIVAEFLQIVTIFKLIPGDVILINGEAVIAGVTAHMDNLCPRKAAGDGGDLLNMAQRLVGETACIGRMMLHSLQIVCSSRTALCTAPCQDFEGIVATTLVQRIVEHRVFTTGADIRMCCQDLLDQCRAGARHAQNKQRPRILSTGCIGKRCGS